MYTLRPPMVRHCVLPLRVRETRISLLVLSIQRCSANLPTEIKQWENIKAQRLKRKIKKFYLKKITLFISKSVTRMKQYLGIKMNYILYLLQWNYMTFTCSHEIKRCLLLGKKAMTNLDNILKSKRHYLTVCLVKAVVFPVAMYGCKSWTIKKA